MNLRVPERKTRFHIEALESRIAPTGLCGLFSCVPKLDLPDVHADVKVSVKIGLGVKLGGGGCH